MSERNVYNNQQVAQLSEIKNLCSGRRGSLKCAVNSLRCAYVYTLKEAVSCIKIPRTLCKHQNVHCASVAWNLAKKQN